MVVVGMALVVVESHLRCCTLLNICYILNDIVIIVKIVHVYLQYLDL